MANEIITQGVEVGSFYDPDTGDVAQTNHIVADTFLFRQQAIENDSEDATGGRFYGGDHSELEYVFVDPDGSLYTMLKGWQEANKRISFVGAGLSRNVQWYERDRLSQVRRVDLQGSVTEGRGDKVFVRMKREGHGSHDIHSNINLLAHLGWEDSDSNGTADNYSIFSGTTTAFSGDVQDVSGSSGTIGIFTNIVFPISGVDVTLSTEHTALHGSGDDRMVLRARDSTSGILQNATLSVNATGRNRVTLTLPANTWELHNRVMLVENITAAGTQSAKFPAARVDGSDTYVAY